MKELSLRRLATDLGLTANALYTYFPTKAHLEDAIADHLLGAAGVASPEPGGPRARILGVALALRTALLAHPGALPLVLRWSGGPGADLLGARVLDDLRALGLESDIASRTAYALIACALGTIALDLAEVPAGSQRASDEEVTRTRRLALDGSTDRAALEDVDVVAQFNSADQYLWGLERILDAVTPGH